MAKFSTFVRRILNDILVIGAFGLAAFVVADNLDLEYLGHGSQPAAALGLAIFGIGATVFAARRVADARRAAQQAYRIAHEDELTGLPNRRRFVSELRNHIEDAKPLSLMLMDLDSFKSVNDLHGHRAGDEVLRVAAQRIQKVLGRRGLAARMGGDEFGVLLPNTAPQDASDIAVDLADELATPVKLAALVLPVRVSIGITTWDPTTAAGLPNEIEPMELALRHADMALYEAKKNELSVFAFRKELDERLHQRVELEDQIKFAIQRGDILPWYQPVFDLRTGDVTGCEVLARWNHPEHGLLAPSVFLPIAGSTGNIRGMTCALLRQAIEDAKSWPAPLVISLNIAPQMVLDTTLPQEILGILAQSDFPPNRLELEIAEGAFAARVEEACEVVEVLRQAGVRIALDDFGTSYAGLAYLKDFNFERVKIDRSFVRELTTSKRGAHIVRIIIEFCRMAGVKTTAGGIETRRELKGLADMGCDSGQGELLSKPQPQSTLLAYLTSLASDLRQAS